MANGQSLTQGATLQNRYQLDAELGRGGMGIVYRAHDTLLDRDVAIKVLSSSGLDSRGRARLLREARAAAQLNHPNIVGVYDAGESDGVPYIVMELIEGPSLFDRHPQSFDEIVSIAHQVCEALEHAHLHGVVHRDLKPENVLLAPDGSIKLMDFGLARSGTSRQSTESALIGTVFYLAPEQALGQLIDGRADLYALGVMLYELTTGQLPFSADDPLAVVAQHIHTPPTPPSVHRADLPPALEAIILRLLAKNPADRFGSAREVALALTQGVAADGQKPAQQTPNNLPAQLSSFIGREREVEEVKRLLSASRLVTLTGAGGSGKTRLALQVAAGLLEASGFHDGVWLVELAPLSDPALVPQAVASALGAHEQSDRSLMETLSGHLQSKHALLLLDNCEHLIGACAVLASALLQVCPNLKILTTSREAIGITGENAWSVPSLSVPDPRNLPSVESEIAPTLMQFESVRLFLDRTAAVQPGFALTNDVERARAVAHICYQLEGIPLAIELAAARMKALSVEQIASRLDDHLNLLTVGSRTALPRHQTLRAAIDWSYELLPDLERRLLGHLSVFANGWTLEAAEAVCGTRDEGGGMKDEANESRVPHPSSPIPSPALRAGPHPSSVLDLLTQLVNKSLVVVEQQADQARYRLLETIRQYAREKLHESGEAEVVQTRHLEFFLALADQAEPALRNEQQVAWLDRLETEHDNLRMALDWSAGQGDTVLAVHLAGALARFWYLRGYWSEGREWLGHLLAKLARGAAPCERDPIRARARALYGAGWLADENGDEVALYSESLALCRSIDDKWGAAFSLRGLGVSAEGRDESEQAAALLNESLALFREIGDSWGMALVLFNQGWLASNHDDRSQAETLWEESLTLFRQTGDRWGIAVSLGALGFLARHQGEYKRAMKLSKESLKLFQALGDKAGIATSLSRLGNVAYRRDDFKQTTLLFEESLALERELGYKRDTAYSISMMGLMSTYQGEYARAGALLDDSLTQWRGVGDAWGIAWTLDNLGLLAYYQLDESRAAARWEESLRLFTEQDDDLGVASALHGLGRIARRQGDCRRAIELLQDCLMRYRQEGDKHNAAIVTGSLARVAHTQGDVERAAALYADSLSRLHDLGAKRGVAESLEGLAGVAATRGQPERAAKMLGAAQAVREAIGAPLPPVERAEWEHDVAAARAQLDPAIFDRALSEGRALTLEQAIAYASTKPE